MRHDDFRALRERDRRYQTRPWAWNPKAPAEDQNSFHSLLRARSATTEAMFDTVRSRRPVSALAQLCDMGPSD